MPPTYPNMHGSYYTSSPSSSYYYLPGRSLSVTWPQKPGTSLVAFEPEDQNLANSTGVCLETDSQTSSGTGELGWEDYAEFDGTIHTEIDDEGTNGPSQTPEYFTPGPSLIRVPDPGSSSPDDQLVQYPNPQGADVEHPEFATEILADAMPMAPISATTFPGVFRNVDFDRIDKVTAELLTLIAAHNLTESWVQTPANAIDSRGNFHGSFSTAVPAESDSPTIYNIPDSSTAQDSLGLPPQSGPSNIPDHQVELQDAHVYSPYSLKYKVDAGPSTVAYTHQAQFESSYTQLAEAPVASSSRQTLIDIHPGQGESYCGQSQHSSSGFTTKFKDNFINLSGPPVRRPRRSKNNRQQPYKQKKGTRRPKSPSPVSDVISSGHDIAATKGHPEHGMPHVHR